MPARPAIPIGMNCSGTRPTFPYPGSAGFPALSVRREVPGAERQLRGNEGIHDWKTGELPAKVRCGWILLPGDPDQGPVDRDLETEVSPECRPADLPGRD